MEQIFENEQYILKILHDDNPENPRTWDNIGRMICFHRRYVLGDRHDFKCAREFFEHLAEEYMTTESGLKVVGEYVDKIISQFTIVYSPEDGGYIIDSDSDVYNPFTETYETEESAEEELKEYRQELMDNPDWDEFSDRELWNIFSPNVVILPLYLYDHSGITIRTTSFGDSWDSGLVGWIYASREKFIHETGYNPEELFGNERKAEQILIQEVEVYDQFIRGDVYGYLLEKKEKCSCCGHIKTEVISSCWGFFGSNFKTNGLIDAIAETQVPQDLVEQIVAHS